MKVLDLDAVRAFVLVADLHSFTRAADALDTTQSAVSLKLKRLEAHLGKQLVERTPRVVRLSADGTAFLGAARDLLNAHERALGSLSVERRRLALGLSEHVAGTDLPDLLAKLNAYDPGLVVELHLGMSAALLAQYDERRLDAVIIRYEPDDAPRDDATVLVAIHALDEAGVAWREAFVGGGVAAVGAAAAAGLAVSPLARRVAPRGLIDVGARLGLPKLPESRVTLHSRLRDPRSVETLKLLTEGLGSGI
jgi:DNA-binding transcriptional LysR family regulator